MSEDLLLHKLGNLARYDERWDRLAAGTLGEEEAAELRALAESSEEAREAYAAFRPLGPEFQAGVVERIRAGAAAPAAKVLPFRRRALQIGALGAVAAAAAVLVVVLRPPALPGYSLGEIAGGSRATRDAGSEPAQWAPGDRFEATLRPQTEVERAGSLEAEAFLARTDSVRVLPVRSEVSDRGAVKIEGMLDEDLPPGDWTLWLVVGRRGALPEPAALPIATGSAPLHERSWAAVPVDLRISPRPP